MAWIIENTKEKDFDTEETLYWSNEFGWVVCNYDVYSDDEHELRIYDLPIDGKWLHVM